MKIAFILRKIIARILLKFDQLFGRYQKSLVVLCYHSFGKDDSRYTVQAKEFEKQIKKISQYADFVGIDEIKRAQKKVYTPGRAKVILTIDDGLASVLDIAPIIKKYQIPVLLFVVSNRKLVNRKELDTQEKLLTWKQIAWLHDQGWTIGCHSATHADFGQLTSATAQNEIILAKQQAEEMLGVPISTFAYPKGAYNPVVLNAVKKAGYIYGFTIEAGTINQASNVAELPRTIIDGTHTMVEIPAIFTPSWLSLRKMTNKLQLWERFMS